MSAAAPYAPVHWNHINLTDDYSWRQNKRVEKGGFRPLRLPLHAIEEELKILRQG